MSTICPMWYPRWASERVSASPTVSGRPRMLTWRERSASVRVASVRSRIAHPRSHFSSSSARVAERARNSSSRRRHGFSPSVVRNSVKRDSKLPETCQTRTVMELPPGAARRFSSRSSSWAKAFSAFSR